MRSVCNHPDLFEVRSIVTAFAMGRSAFEELCNVSRKFSVDVGGDIAPGFNLGRDLESGVVPGQLERLAAGSQPFFEEKKLEIREQLENIAESMEFDDAFVSIVDYQKVYKRRLLNRRLENWSRIERDSKERCTNSVVYGHHLLKTAGLLGSLGGAYNLLSMSRDPRNFLSFGNSLRDMIKSIPVCHVGLILF
jgi:helicase SWR1